MQTLGEVRAAVGDRAAYLAVGVDPSAPAEDPTGLLGAAGYPDLPAAVDAALVFLAAISSLWVTRRSPRQTA